MEIGLAALGRHTPSTDAMVSCAAFAACVSVDTTTGAASVERLIVAHDGGTIVNLANVDAQLQGAMAQGLGQALMEAVQVDEYGQPLTGSFMDYAMPRATDVPRVEIVHLPAQEGDGFAPRGVGEAGAAGVPAALFNAVNDALAPIGSAMDALPMSAPSIWQKLRDATR